MGAPCAFSRSSPNLDPRRQSALPGSRRNHRSPAPCSRTRSHRRHRLPASRRTRRPCQSSPDSLNAPWTRASAPTPTKWRRRFRVGSTSCSRSLPGSRSYASRPYGPWLVTSELVSDELRDAVSRSFTSCPRQRSEGTCSIQRDRTRRHLVYPSQAKTPPFSSATAASL